MDLERTALQPSKVGTYLYTLKLLLLMIFVLAESKKCPWIAYKAGGQDGFGGEVLARVGLMAAARSKGFGYCHSPFYHLHHVGGSEDRLEKYMNLSGAASLIFGSVETCSTEIGRAHV